MDNDPTELPAYSPPSELQSPREFVKHSYSLTNKQGKTWARLNILSKARSSESLPRVYEGESIEGSVDLDLSDDTPMKSVTVKVSPSGLFPTESSTLMAHFITEQVTGELITDANSRYEFVEDFRLLWTAPSKGEMISLGSDPSATKQPFKGKLKGTFHWPFQLLLPKTVDLPDNKGIMKSYQLPCSLYITFTPITIHYQVDVQIKHGSLFHPDHT